MHVPFLLALFALSPILAAPTNSTNLLSTCPPSRISAAYCPAYGKQPSSAIPWKDIDIGLYFVAVTTASGFALPAGQKESDISSFVAGAHKQNKKAIFTIGGWTGSVYFSSLVATEENRYTLARSVKSFMDKYDFDGADFDWEYPNQLGVGSNQRNPNDTANLLRFLKIMRSVVGPSKVLAAAVSPTGFSGPDGAPIVDVSDFARYLDYITVMGYDIFGQWSATTGPNAPLHSCVAGSPSDESAISYWTNAGFPACRILLGIPQYSHQFTTASDQLATTYFDGKASNAFQKMATQQKSDPSLSYLDLVDAGYMTPNGSKGVNGFVRYFDECTAAPFLFNSRTRQYISYEDSRSVSLKAQFVKSKGLAGVNYFFATTMDDGEMGTFAAGRAGMRGDFA